MLEIPHLGYIVAAYGVTAIALIAMIAAVWLDYRALSVQLATLERSRGDKEGGFR